MAHDPSMELSTTAVKVGPQDTHGNMTQAQRTEDHYAIANVYIFHMAFHM